MRGSFAAPALASPPPAPSACSSGPCPGTILLPGRRLPQKTAVGTTTPMAVFLFSGRGGWEHALRRREGNPCGEEAGIHHLPLFPLQDSPPSACLPGKEGYITPLQPPDTLQRGRRTGSRFPRKPPPTQNAEGDASPP